MKKYLAAVAAALALSAAAHAQIIYIPPVRADAGVKAYFRLYSPGTDRANACMPMGGGYPGFGGPGCGAGGGGISFGTGGLQAGPWYSYWPYEAHFQVPAPQPYPFYPPPQVSPIPGGLPPGPGYPPPYIPQPQGSGSGTGSGTGSPQGRGSGSVSLQQSAYWTTANSQAVPSYWYKK
jgi:hypothetical protein